MTKERPTQQEVDLYFVWRSISELKARLERVFKGEPVPDQSGLDTLFVGNLRFIDASIKRLLKVAEEEAGEDKKWSFEVKKCLYIQKTVGAMIGKIDSLTVLKGEDLQKQFASLIINCNEILDWVKWYNPYFINK